MNRSNVMLLAALAAALAGCKERGSVVSGGNAMAKMATFKDQMCACKDTACAKRVSSEMAAWSKSQSSDKPAAMTADDQKRATELGTQLGECMTRATSSAVAGSGSSTAPAAAAPAGSGSGSGTGSGSALELNVTKNTQGLPPECDQYKAAIEKIATCEHLAKAARDTLVKGYEDAAARWASLPEAAKATLSPSCQGGYEAVLGVGVAQCGW